MNNKIELKDGETICPKCKGHKYPDYSEPNKNMMTFPCKCKTCNGEGKLDWIENVVGKKKKYPEPRIIDASFKIDDKEFLNFVENNIDVEKVVNNLVNDIDNNIMNELLKIETKK